LKCFRERVLSPGRSAELTGLSKWDFIEFLSDNNVPVLDFEEEELAREFETEERLRVFLIETSWGRHQFPGR